MAVLKSFELDGNKLSFANWISNLSPTCTPFTCMIGKEKINQTQYSWQTDTLAPATAESFNEGSQAESQPRAATKIITNFTSTIRRAVNVSHTNESVAAYGRKDELKYQLTKAGKEVMRDLEFANLSKTEGHIGSATQASRYSGFKELVAKVNTPDQDTKAVVHREYPHFEGDSETDILKEIFKVTTNLFIAGSKANKIMFHPKHVFLFNDYIGYNEEEPHIHRMFDGMEEKYNALITKIKDPVGRVYELIPNRFMPEDEFYIFNENDWTQMILRAPQRVKLGKTGPSHTVMIETEIGLRHRHPYASGILSIISVDKRTEVTPEKTTLTAYVGDDAAEIVLDVYRGDGTAVEDMDITWESSDPTILDIDPKQTTTDSNGTTSVTMLPKKAGHVTVRAFGDGMLTQLLELEVVDPTVKTSLDREGMNLGERIHCIASVQDYEEKAAADGTPITFFANSGNVFFLTDPADVGSAVTEVPTSGGTGTADTYIACEAPGTYRIWTSVHGVSSPKRTIYVGSAQLQIGWVQKQDRLVVGKDGATAYEVVVKDKDGVHIHAGAKAKWSVDRTDLVTLSDAETVTNDVGETKITITPVKPGTVNLRVHCYGDEIILPLEVGILELDNTILPENIPLVAAPNRFEASLQTQVFDGNNNPVPGVDVTWTVTPSTLLELTSVQGKTDAQGIASTGAKGIAKGSGTINSVCNGVPGTTIHFSVGQGGVLTFRADPNPATVGGEVTLSGTLRSESGLAIPDTDITFFVETAPHPSIQKVTTDALGNYEDKFTPTVAGTQVIDAICASLQKSAKLSLQIDNP